MNSQQKIINVMTICRKADKLIIGFDAVKEAVQEGNASCVVVMEDISQNTLKEVRFFCKNCMVDIVEVELDSYDMVDIIGKKVVVAAICDHGLAEKIRALGNVTKPLTKRKSRAELDENK